MSDSRSDAASREPRVALVTGASAGVGLAIARGLAARGFRVGIGARRRERLETAAATIAAEGGVVFAHTLDVADAASVDAFIAAIETRFGPVDVAVANAGICIPGLLQDVPTESIRTEIATNLMGPMFTARRCIPAMLARGSGDLVFISSDNARAPRTFQAGYSASKAGVENLARVLAMELEGTGVRVSTIRMGPVSTEFGHDWESGLIQRMLASWKHFGLQRGLSFMEPEAVADAVLTAVTARHGSVVAHIELQPTSPPTASESRAD